MATVWTSNEIMNFLNLYRKEACIWNPSHRHHKDKVQVKKAWDRLADAVGLTVEEAKRKKETLMASFRLNHRKVLTTQRSATNSDEIFKPVWLYYDVMASFLADVYQCKTITPTEDYEEVLLVERSPPQSPQADYVELETLESEMDDGIQSAPVISNSIHKRRYHNLVETNEQVKSALSALNKVLCDKLKSPNEDECDLFGRLVAKKLKKLTDNDRQELMYEIDGLFLQKRQSSIRQSHTKNEQPTTP